MKREAPLDLRFHEERLETNEEIMHWSQDRFNYVRLRVQFQIRSIPAKGKPQYMGLKGRSITIAARSPGIALQLVDYIQDAIERFVPSIVTREISGETEEIPVAGRSSAESESCAQFAERPARPH